jgi:hypothetical protein
VRIARQVGQHRPGSGERALGVDPPFASTQRCQPLGEGLGIGQRSVLTEELQLPCAMSLHEFFEEATTERPRQHAHRQEETWLATHPRLAVGREPAAWHNTVHVRMMRQRRAPGMQHQGRADARAQVLGVCGNGEQGLGGHVEQHTTDHGLVLQRDVGDGRRQRENDVVILDGQQVAPPASSQRLAALLWHFAQCRLWQELYEICSTPQPSQRKAWPPSAALRHCSMADMILSWPRLRWPRCAARQATPWTRKMSPTSSRDCSTTSASR